jgi:hypothetical protein
MGSDRHVASRRVNTLTAAAQILQPIRSDEPKAEGWHDHAWHFRDVVGELRFAEMWLGNSFSRASLCAASRPEPGGEPQKLESGPAVDLMAALAGGPGGLQEMLRQFGTYLMVPGVGFMIGEPTEAGGPDWIVRSAEEIRLAPGKRGADRTYQIAEGEGSKSWRDIDPEAHIVKVLRPHPRRHWEPDSPTRSALPVLNELDLLTQHVAATATSRLAGAGVQAFPTEMEFEGDWEKFIDEWIEAVTKPIKDRSLASAYVPFPVRMPGAMIQWFKEGLIRYNTPFDDQAMRLREEGIQRLGNAMDMPRQVLTGEARNHWGDWQVEEAGLKIHVEPGLALIADAFTIGYLWPGLESVAAGSSGARADIERFREENPDGDFIVWYDTSDLRVRPDRSSDAKDLYDRWEIDGEALRHETGLSDAEPLDLNDPEIRTRVGFHLLQFESTVSTALELLEIEVSTPPVVNTPPSPPALPPGQPEPAEPGSRALPETREREPDMDEEPAAVAWPAQVLVAACDGIVHRALERAGNKYMRLMKRGEHGACDRPPAELYLCDADVYHLRMQMLADKLLDGAWERVPALAATLDEDAEPLASTLDAYVRLLIRTKQAHTWDRLSHALGACPCQTEAS